MRIHSLTVTGFGPFAAREHIDFERLNSAGLFLLHGPTGSGKTSLLDAVGFALFGQVPGPRQTAKQLRSDHAAADTMSEVCLDVTLSGRRLRITRRPEQERPKKKGGPGTVRENASVLLTELDATTGEWVTRSTRIEEAGQLIGLLVGLTADQFFQVVLLPQNDFARFLRAKSDERTKLLEKLFDTGRFKDAAEWLDQQRLTEERALRHARAAVTAVLGRVGQVLGLSDVAVAEQAGGDPTGWLSQRVDVVAARCAQAASHLSEAGRGNDEALVEHAAQLELQRRQDIKRDAQRRRAALLAQEPDIAEIRERLAAHGRARTGWGPVHLLDEELAALATATEACARALGAVTPLGWSAELSYANVSELRIRGRQAHEQVGALTPLLAVAAGLERRRIDLDELRARARDLRTRVDELGALLDEAPARRERLVAEITAAREAEASMPGLRGAAEQARDRRAAATRLTAAQVTRESLEAERDAAHRAWLDARERAVALGKAWLDGAAAALAADLADGAPCPVCGGVEHPQPAPVAAGAVSRADVDQADEEVQRSECVMNARQASLDAANGEVARLEQAVGGATIDGASLQEAEALVREQLECAQRRAAQRPSHERALDELERELQQVTQAHASAGQEVAALTATEARDAASVNADATTVARAAGEAATLADRIAQLQAEAATAEAAASTAHAALTRQEAVERASAAAADAARDQGFDSVADLRGAVLRDTERVRDEAALSLHRDEESQVALLLADPDIAAVTLEPGADVTAAAAAVGAATAALSQASILEARADAEHVQLTQLAEVLRLAVAEVPPVLRRYEVAKMMGDLAAGRSPNVLRMRLEAFVLAARLEQVAELASVRLLRMSGGRYHLRHSDGSSSSGRQRAGLELRVFDSWTMKERDTGTLSGGETFQASLALALGLADVVQRESGGLTMDTLFIDEGFGSLDPQSLERVMDTLDALRDGGRVVGVVSHVADMQERIQARLQVAGGESGSRVLAS